MLEIVWWIIDYIVLWLINLKNNKNNDVYNRKYSNLRKSLKDRFSKLVI